MNDENPEIAPSENPPPPLPYKDRSAGLVVFGVFTILIGCVCALFVPMVMAGAQMSAKTSGTAPNTSGLGVVMLMYGFLAGTLVSLGIGSIQGRRWARALLLIFSWTWLVMGAVMLAGVGFVMPGALELPTAPGQPPLPEAAKTAAMIFVLLFVAFCFVVLPAIWVYFYNSKHVKATCEAKDPVVRWTDGSPLPVLAYVIFLGFGSAMMLMMPLSYNGVVAFFGIFLSGIPGTIVYLTMATVMAYSAWASYHLARRGWWLVFISMGAFMISNVMTYARHDISEMYGLLGYSAAQITELQKFNVLGKSGMMWLSALSAIPWFIYLIFIERYFRRAR